MGIMVVGNSVYWTIDFTDPEVLKGKTTQLQDDDCAGSQPGQRVIIWSVGNETPDESRTAFMRELIEDTAAGWNLAGIGRLLAHGSKWVTMVDDPLANMLTCFASTSTMAGTSTAFFDP